MAIETKVINGAVQSSQRNAAKHKSADALKSLGRGPVGSVGSPGPVGEHQAMSSNMMIAIRDAVRTFDKHLLNPA